MSNRRNFNRYILLIKLALRCDTLLGLYHRLRKTVVTDKVDAATFPQEVTSQPLAWTRSRNIFLKYFEDNQTDRSQLLQTADSFCEGKVKIYQQDILLEQLTIDQFEKNKKRANVHFKDLRFYWEVYRCKYLFNVALAYGITHDKKYAASLMRFMKRWKEFSPIFNNEIRYNGMEAAIKIINLSYLNVFLQDSAYYQSQIRSILIDCIIQHAEYINKNYDITLYGLESNHSIFCAAGLIYTALLFPKYKKSKRWYKFGMRVINRALKKQFSADGVNFESSPQYQRLVFELLLILLAMLHRSQQASTSYFEESVAKIGESLQYLVHANNSIARFGDNDGGKLLYDIDGSSKPTKINFLGWSSRELCRPPFETLIFQNIPSVRNLLAFERKNKFRIGNYISYRNPMLSLIVTANNIGTQGKGNHQHNDFLSFELYTKTTPFIVDRWSFCYTGNQKLRNRDRSTYIHNNIEIDKREIVQFDHERMFEMLGNLTVKIDRIEDTSTKWIAVVRHDGYKSLRKGSQRHIRTFEVLKDQNVIRILDFLEGTGTHSATLNLLIPKLHWNVSKQGEAILFVNDKELFSIRSTIGSFKIGQTYISEDFLSSAPAHLISIETTYTNNLQSELTIEYNRK